jgi:hypothetical protein
MHRTPTSFRIGKVHAYLRGRIWYLCYHENGRRRRPRVGPDRHAARQLAAQVNAQLEAGAPAALSFEAVGVRERRRRRWLEHHEQVLQSSVQTVNRYRTATDHLLRFLDRRPAGADGPEGAASSIRHEPAGGERGSRWSATC